jgi:hypothetical protein
MKLLLKIAELFNAAPVQDPAARTRALSRLGPPRSRSKAEASA